jgi:multimeric flavodoxin WrbA
MKVIAFNGSARKDGNTGRLIDMAAEELGKEGIETEKIWIGGGKLRGCLACMKCAENRDGKCVINSDPLNEYIEKIMGAEGMIFGSPTYFGNVSPDIKALIDRAGLVSMVNGCLFKRKVGAPVIAVRRGGAVDVSNAINHFFFLNQVIVPGSDYWNFAFGLMPGEVEADRQGVATMKTLGENMAWLLKKIHNRD